MNTITRDVNIATVAELIGDQSRAAMLDALLGKQALPAGELAYRAGISPQTASVHLAKLVEGGLLVLITRGRYRYYELAGPEVAHALEALAVIAPPQRTRSLRASIITEQIRTARTCYDHLAGKLGVHLTRMMLKSGWILLQDQERCYCVTDEGKRFLADFQIDVMILQWQRRQFARACLDWSEREYHLAGALGAAITERLFQLRWIERKPTGRAVHLTEAGQQGINDIFGETLQV